MFKMMIELLQARNYGNGNGCKSYNCYANVNHCVDVRKRVRMSDRIFTTAKHVSTLLANQLTVQ